MSEIIEIPGKTLNEVCALIREASFDRFLTPTAFLTSSRPLLNLSVQVADTFLSIYSGVSPAPLATFFFSDYPTIGKLFRAIQKDFSLNTNVDYGATFITSEPSSSLFAQPGLLATFNDEEAAQINRSYFFSDEYIYEKFIKPYALGYLGKCLPDIHKIPSDVEFLPYPNDLKLIYWCAYHAVEDRRSFELAAQYTGGSAIGGNAAFLLSQNRNKRITVQIGAVYTLNDDPRATTVAGDLNKLGTTNVLGDEDSFWYRLQLQLRLKFEQLFGDYSLRPNEVVQSTAVHRDSPDKNWYAYFDSFPFRVSPFARGLFDASESITSQGNVIGY